MSKAIKIRTLAGWAGNAALYRMEPPLEGNEYVIASAIDTALRYEQFGTPRPMQIETYIFAASETGEVVDYSELPGSIKGTLDHAEALLEAGYEVAA